MFDFYRNDDDNTWRIVWKWHILGHVCQRWRRIVLTSPHRLNLQILCRRSTPVRKLLNIWPAFPIALSYYSKSIRSSADEAIATLEHPGRVCNVTLDVTGTLLEKMVKAMHVPFPVLTHLHIMIAPGAGNTLPREFLGGSAPSLQEISLYGVPYPSLPRLLLSASDLVNLLLRNIPPSGYISPEAIVVGLAALPRLKFFSMEFQSASSRPDRIHTPPATRTVLPSGIWFEFKGASEYLEALVAQIDSPQLEWICINYFNQVADFQASQLCQFIDRSVGPQETLFSRATVRFSRREVSFVMFPHSNHEGHVSITTICEGIDWQVSHMTHLLSQFSVALSNVVHLNVTNLSNLEGQLEGIDDVEWRDILHPFSTVKSLYVSKKLAEHISLVLEDITEGMVLPSLDSIRLTGQPASSAQKLLARRRLSSTL